MNADKQRQQIPPIPLLLLSLASGLVYIICGLSSKWKYGAPCSKSSKKVLLMVLIYKALSVLNAVSPIISHGVWFLLYNVVLSKEKIKIKCINMNVTIHL